MGNDPANRKAADAKTPPPRGDGPTVCPSCHQTIAIEQTDEAPDRACPACGSALGGPGREAVTAATEFSLPAESADKDVRASSPLSASSDTTRYEVLRDHARGGLGKVSVAMDLQLRREVAFKELLDQHAGNPDRRLRFVREAEITGSLEHPGVVPIYGLGQYADGRPFYSMRFVRGESLRKAISRFHETDDSARDSHDRALQFRKLLGRFVDVCNAMEYAHSRGVIHRDLKPENIMLGPYGETLVVDWGLAKQLGEKTDPAADDGTSNSAGAPAATRIGRVVGTPAYMAPEQAAGEVDRLGPAADVFALGATLYCLLTNQPPYTGQGTDEMLESVRQCRFPRPREVRAGVAPALETVCLKAMAARPEDRYASPAAMAEDIEHWLADEPVSAHRETMPQRLGRWMRRHRTWTQAGAASLVVVAAVAVLAAVLINRARDRAVTLAVQNEQLAIEADDARQDALLRLAEARDTVDLWVTGASKALEYFPGVQDARRRLLEKAAEDYERFAEQQSDDPGLELERGRAKLRLGDVRHLLGESTEAEQAYRAGMAVFEGLADDPTVADEVRLELNNTRVKLGLVLAETGRAAQADTQYDAAVADLRKLVERSPNDGKFRDALATALLNYGARHAEAGQGQPAEELLLEAIDQFQKLAQSDPETSHYRAGMSTARNLLGRIYVRAQQYKEALDQLEQALSCFGSLVDEEPDNLSFLESRASTRVFLANVFRQVGRYDDEFDAYQRAIDDFALLAKAQPDVPIYAEQLALTRTDLGQLLLEEDNARDAEPELREALAVFTQLVVSYSNVPHYHEQQAAAQDTLGRALRDLDRDEEAEAALRSAVQTYQALAQAFADVPQYRERLAVGRSHLGQVLHKVGNPSDAQGEYEAAIALLEALEQSTADADAFRNELAFVHEHLATLHRNEGEPEKAAGELRRVLEIRSDLASQTPRYVHNLARLLVECAEPELRDPQRALDLMQPLVEELPRNTAYRITLATAEYRLGQFATCIETIEEAVRLRGEARGRDGFLLAMAVWQAGEEQDALKYFYQADDWLKQHCPGNPALLRVRREAASLLGISDEQ